MLEFIKTVNHYFMLIKKLFQLLDINCKITFKGGCKEWKTLRIKVYDDRSYSVKECYVLCSKTDNCAMFNIKSETNHCVLFNSGCTNDNNKRMHTFYALETCSGIKCKLMYLDMFLIRSNKN